jgi:hypothetical protein
VAGVRSEDDHLFTRHRRRLIDMSVQYPRTQVGTQALRLAALEIGTTQDAAEGLVYAQKACSWAKHVDNTELSLECDFTLAITQYFCGEVREARATLVRALRVAEQTGAVLNRLIIVRRLFCVLTELDARAEAEQCLESLSAVDGLRDSPDYAEGLANKALLFFHCGDLIGCIAACDEALTARPMGGPWIELGVRALRALCHLELGSTLAAKREAVSVRAALESSNVIAGDISYPVMLVSRIATICHEEAQIEGLVRSKLDQYARRDYVCRCRLQLALADAVARRSRAEALTLAESVVGQAERRGLMPLYEQGLAAIRRIKRKSRNG